MKDKCSQITRIYTDGTDFCHAEVRSISWRIVILIPATVFHGIIVESILSLA